MSYAILSIGMSGGDVPDLHQILIEQGFGCGEDPNAYPQIFGPATESAVKLFQASMMARTVGSWLSMAWSVPAHGGRWRIPLDRHRDSLGRCCLTCRRRRPPTDRSGCPAVGMGGAAQAGLRDPGWLEPQPRDRSLHRDVRQAAVHFRSSLVRLFRLVELRQGAAWLSLRPHRWSPVYRSFLPAQHPRLDDRGSVPDASKIKPGDIAVIANGQDHGHAFHVAAVLDGNIWTVEGNSGNAIRSKQRAISTCKYFINFDSYARSLGLG